MFDPIVKAGSEKLTAADISYYLEHHPEAKRQPSVIWRNAAELEALDRRREHPIEGPDFEAPDGDARTPVRFPR